MIERLKEGGSKVKMRWRQIDNESPLDSCSETIVEAIVRYWQIARVRVINHAVVADICG